MRGAASATPILPLLPAPAKKTRPPFEIVAATASTASAMTGI